MQQSRRTNPYPFTWEIPAAVAVAALLMLVLGVQVGRAGANLAAGAGIAFPPREELFTSLVGVLRGDAGSGLNPRPAPVAQRGALVGWVVAVELVNVAVMSWIGKILLDRWGPRRMQGMASKAEVEKLLGRSRLRRVRSIIRPDLHGKDRA